MNALKESPGLIYNVGPKFTRKNCLRPLDFAALSIFSSETASLSIS
jgi:hypothetical protein